MRTIPQTMQALQMQGLNQLVRVTLPVPEPGPDEVLILTSSTTICTSDLHDLTHNPFKIRFPRVLGHEGAGTIVKCGENVKDFRSGMRVAVHPVVPCKQCDECRRGYEHVCTNMQHLGYNREGTFAEYFVQRSDRIIALPEHVKARVAPLLEPVAVCLQAIARAGNMGGGKVLIVGDGPFGNIIARLAVRAGAEVIVYGKGKFRLSMIPNVTIADEPPQKSMVIAILAVSAAEAVSVCIDALKPRGRMVIFSGITDPVPVDLFKVHLMELEILGACNDEDRMQDSLACLGDESLALEELVTHEIPFEDWEKAFDLARNGHDQALKVSLVFNN